MKITRHRSGQYLNTWNEGGRVHVQDIKTGKSWSMSRATAREKLRSGSAKEARKYADD